MSNDLISAGAAADILRLSSTQGVAYLEARGELTAERTAGGHRRYRRADVEALARQRDAALLAEREADYRQSRAAMFAASAAVFREAAGALPDNAPLNLDDLPHQLDAESLRRHPTTAGECREQAARLDRLAASMREGRGRLEFRESPDAEGVVVWTG
jgi:DNA-binding transcriptional MerR regulator